MFFLFSSFCSFILSDKSDQKLLGVGNTKFRVATGDELRKAFNARFLVLTVLSTLDDVDIFAVTTVTGGFFGLAVSPTAGCVSLLSSLFIFCASRFCIVQIPDVPTIRWPSSAHRSTHLLLLMAWRRLENFVYPCVPFATAAMKVAVAAPVTGLLSFVERYHRIKERLRGASYFEQMLNYALSHTNDSHQRELEAEGCEPVDIHALRIFLQSQGHPDDLVTLTPFNFAVPVPHGLMPRASVLNCPTGWFGGSQRSTHKGSHALLPFFPYEGSPSLIESTDAVYFLAVEVDGVFSPPSIELELRKFECDRVGVLRDTSSRRETEGTVFVMGMVEVVTFGHVQKTVLVDRVFVELNHIRSTLPFYQLVRRCGAVLLRPLQFEDFSVWVGELSILNEADPFGPVSVRPVFRTFQLFTQDTEVGPGRFDASFPVVCAVLSRVSFGSRENVTLTVQAGRQWFGLPRRLTDMLSLGSYAGACLMESRAVRPDVGRLPPYFQAPELKIFSAPPPKRFVYGVGVFPVGDVLVATSLIYGGYCFNPCGLPLSRPFSIVCPADQSSRLSCFGKVEADGDVAFVKLNPAFASTLEFMVDYRSVFSLEFTRTSAEQFSDASAVLADNVFVLECGDEFFEQLKAALCAFTTSECHVFLQPSLPVSLRVSLSRFFGSTDAQVKVLSEVRAECGPSPLSLALKGPVFVSRNMVTQLDGAFPCFSAGLLMSALADFVFSRTGKQLSWDRKTLCAIEVVQVTTALVKVLINGVLVLFNFVSFSTFLTWFDGKVGPCLPLEMKRFAMSVVGKFFCPDGSFTKMLVTDSIHGLNSSENAALFLLWNFYIGYHYDKGAPGLLSLNPEWRSLEWFPPLFDMLRRRGCFRFRSGALSPLTETLTLNFQFLERVETALGPLSKYKVMARGAVNMGTVVLDSLSGDLQRKLSSAGLRVFYCPGSKMKDVGGVCISTVDGVPPAAIKAHLYSTDGDVADWNGFLFEGSLTRRPGHPGEVQLFNGVLPKELPTSVVKCIFCLAEVEVVHYLRGCRFCFGKSNGPSTTACCRDHVREAVAEGGCVVMLDAASSPWDLLQCRSQSVVCGDVSSVKFGGRSVVLTKPLLARLLVAVPPQCQRRRLYGLKFEPLVEVMQVRARNQAVFVSDAARSDVASKLQHLIVYCSRFGYVFDPEGFELVVAADLPDYTGRRIQGWVDFWQHLSLPVPLCDDELFSSLGCVESVPPAERFAGCVALPRAFISDDILKTVVVLVWGDYVVCPKSQVRGFLTAPPLGLSFVTGAQPWHGLEVLPDQLCLTSPVGLCRRQFNFLRDQFPIGPRVARAPSGPFVHVTMCNSVEKADGLTAQIVASSNGCWLETRFSGYVFDPMAAVSAPVLFNPVPAVVASDLSGYQIGMPIVESLDSTSASVFLKGIRDGAAVVNELWPDQSGAKSLLVAPIPGTTLLRCDPEMVIDVLSTDLVQRVGTEHDIGPFGRSLQGVPGLYRGNCFVSGSTGRSHVCSVCHVETVGVEADCVSHTVKCIYPRSITPHIDSVYVLQFNPPKVRCFSTVTGMELTFSPAQNPFAVSASSAGDDMGVYKRVRLRVEKRAVDCALFRWPHETGGEGEGAVPIGRRTEAVAVYGLSIRTAWATVGLVLSTKSLDVKMVESLNFTGSTISDGRQCYTSVSINCEATPPGSIGLCGVCTASFANYLNYVATHIPSRRYVFDDDAFFVPGTPAVWRVVTGLLLSQSQRRGRLYLVGPDPDPLAFYSLDVPKKTSPDGVVAKFRGLSTKSGKPGVEVWRSNSELAIDGAVLVGSDLIELFQPRCLVCNLFLAEVGKASESGPDKWVHHACILCKQCGHVDGRIVKSTRFDACPCDDDDSEDEDESPICLACGFFHVKGACDQHAPGVVSVSSSPTGVVLSWKKLVDEELRPAVNVTCLPIPTRCSECLVVGFMIRGSECPNHVTVGWAFDQCLAQLPVVYCSRCCTFHRNCLVPEVYEIVQRVDLKGVAAKSHREVTVKVVGTDFSVVFTSPKRCLAKGCSERAAKGPALDPKKATMVDYRKSPLNHYFLVKGRLCPIHLPVPRADFEMNSLQQLLVEHFS